MAWGDGIGSEESMGGAMSGAAAGTAIMPGWGTAIGAGLGLLMGGSSSAHKKKQRKIEAELSAKQSELSPWLSGQAAQTNVPMKGQQEMASPWVGAASLAKAYSEQQQQQDKMDLLKKLSAWQSPVAGRSPSMYDRYGNIMAGPTTNY